MKATTNGLLNVIPDCQIVIPGAGTIDLRSLPDIGDSKSASYNSENIIGRSFPLYTYSHSGDRSISMQLHFFILQPDDAETNIDYLRMIQSAVYPRQGNGGAPYMPPPVCTLQCGNLLADDVICAVLQSYSVKFPTDVVWYEGGPGNYCPFRFDVDTTWLVVYTSSDLPYADRIVETGR